MAPFEGYFEYEIPLLFHLDRIFTLDVTRSPPSVSEQLRRQQTLTEQYTRRVAELELAIAATSGQLSAAQVPLLCDIM